MVSSRVICGRAATSDSVRRLGTADSRQTRGEPLNVNLQEHRETLPAALSPAVAAEPTAVDARLDVGAESVARDAPPNPEPHARVPDDAAAGGTDAVASAPASTTGRSPTEPRANLDPLAVTDATDRALTFVPADVCAFAPLTMYDLILDESRIGIIENG